MVYLISFASLLIVYLFLKWIYEWYVLKNDAFFKTVFSDSRVTLLFNLIVIIIMLWTIREGQDATKTTVNAMQVATSQTLTTLQLTTALTVTTLQSEVSYQIEAYKTQTSKHISALEKSTNKTINEMRDIESRTRQAKITDELRILKMEVEYNVAKMKFVIDVQAKNENIKSGKETLTFNFDTVAYENGLYFLNIKDFEKLNLVVNFYEQLREMNILLNLAILYNAAAVQNEDKYRSIAGISGKVIGQMSTTMDNGNKIIEYLDKQVP